ncbi:CynX/NimT family MFS transporter [Haloglomus litoreum]|uniref:MFS transporter n=1 Tax=Haloglomus litoreum TaxID=3034026 RepID=UPI0023E7D141|nr:MFS transporter [Haloglomus sp. DT116]
MSAAPAASAGDPAERGAQRPSRASVALLVLGGLAYGCLLFAWFSLPAYLATIRTDLALSATEAGVLAGAVPLTYVPVGLFSGALTDRLGGERAVGAGVTLVGVAHVARSVAPDFPTMLAATLLLGVGGTGITFGLPKLVADRFPERLVGRASAVYLVGSTLGTAAAFGLGRPTIGPALGGWRPFFGAAGVVVVGFAACWWVALALAERRAPVPDRSASESSLAALRAVARTPAVALLVAVGFVYLFVVHGLQGWLTAVLEARGASPTLAARVTTLLVVAQLVGTVALAPLAERAGRRRAAVPVAGLVLAGGTAGVAVAVDPLVAAALVAGVGLGLGTISPLLRALPVELEGVGAERTGTAVGLVFAVGEIGGFAGPALVGALRDATGSFVPGLGLLATAGLLAVVAGLGLVRGE